MSHSRLITTTIVLAMGCAGGSSSVTTGSGSGSGSGEDFGAGSGSGSGSDVQPVYPTAHPRIYLGANLARLQAALAAARPAATRMKTIADDWIGGADLWGFDAWNAAIFGPLTGDPKYCTAAIAAVDTQVSTAESAIAAGSAPVVAADDYLDVGELIGDVALVYDWCNDAVSASQKTRWLAYANQAVWNVWHPADATWGGKTFAWTGWATDDPADNYYYSFLRATMLLGLAEKGEDPAGDTWIDQFRTTKMFGELLPTFDADLVGGGSREGTGYGVAMRGLFQLYDFWYATTGEPLAVLTGHTRASMLAMIHQIVPTLDRFAPIGDQSRDSTASMFDYQRNYLQELVHLFPQDPLASPTQELLATCSVPTMEDSFMAIDDFLYDNADVAATTMSGLGTAYYAAGIGELFARSGWDSHATWINLIAGPYTEAHAHQDQGSLMIYKDGWLAYDAVIDSHSGLRQETAAHGLVRIDSGGSAVPQVATTTSQLAALHAGTGWLYAAADVTPAYNGNAAVGKVQREMVYLEPDTVVVYDRVTSAAGTTQTWQLASPVAPTISGATATISGAHALHVQRLAPSATASVFDYTSDPSGDYASGYRLDETMPGGDQRYLHVVSIDGAVTATSSPDDSTVTVTLASGQSATVAFDRDAIGATLTYLGATTTLAAGVDTLPE
ncbi:MAG TPA: hypothetical protein VLX92_15285 [Kofleriaceae bacterium]|nr:hypothetical protein [Kofleriaceae bacterium]